MSDADFRAVRYLAVVCSDDGKSLAIEFEDGAKGRLKVVLPAPEAHQLLPVLHQKTMEAADIIARGPRRPARTGEPMSLTAIRPRTLGVTADMLSGNALLVFDQNLPTQAAYEIPKAQVQELAQRLLPFLGGARRTKPN